MIKIELLVVVILGVFMLNFLNASKNFDLIGFFENDDKRAIEIQQQYNIRSFDDINELSNQISAKI